MAAPIEAKSDYLLPRHRGPWTIEDVLELPEDTTQRVELVDGALLVSPLGGLRHQRLIMRIGSRLLAEAPAPMEPTIELNLQLPGGRLLIPDFSVLRRSGLDTLMVDAADVLLVGEVISPSSRMQDRILRSQLYREAEIPYYLLVDPNGNKGRVPSLVLLEFVDAEYKEIAWDQDGRIELERPFPVTIDLSAC